MKKRRKVKELVKEPVKEMVFVKEKRCVVERYVNQGKKVKVLGVRTVKDEDAGEDAVVEVRDNNVAGGKVLKRKDESEEKKYLISELLKCKWN